MKVDSNDGMVTIEVPALLAEGVMEVLRDMNNKNEGPLYEAVDELWNALVDEFNYTWVDNNYHSRNVEYDRDAHSISLKK